MEGKYWKGKKVLVTGADGFMGSHLTERLVEAGAKVSVLVRGSSVSGTYKYELKNIPHLKKDLQHILAVNISSSDTIPLVAKLSPSVIFHLAADAYVPYSFDHPFEVMATNLHGTLNILHAAMKIPNLERVVCTSSSEIYGTAQTAAISESHPLNPTSPYAASKVAADRFAFSYQLTYGLPIAIIRPFNTFGPRHTYDVIPKFIDLAVQGKPITIYGDGLQSRDFTYVDDMVGAFLVMGRDKKAIGQAVNFGTGRDVSINRTAELIVKLTRSRSKIVHIEKRLAEVKKLRCNPGLANRLFGWNAKVGIQEGLKRNIEWHLKYRLKNS
ncbi:MAG TPA: GDP-mannose 4,6-dehydratase [Verrucomicrobiae bacterium]|nr:GDP-mannose 4,6-dehydratase [Verrucomicrobiae bacterium]